VTPYPRILSFALVMFVVSAWPARAQEPAAAQTAPAAGVTAEQLQQILTELQAQGQRIKELETELEMERKAALAAKGPPAAPDAAKEPAETAHAPVGSTVAAVLPGIAVAGSLSPQEQQPPHEHSMKLPGGGPILKISGFADFNLEFGEDANPLIFPLGAKAHDTFQFGELDLFASSQLSKTVSFLGEIVIGPGETSDENNVWGIDIERLEVTYKPSRYFNISGGRYHTSIGYYNTAYHHGTWFQTATGRPFMDYFEDSGGVLPVHGVGISATGLVPGSGRLEMHWIAELSNGRSSDANLQSVQNFLSDKDHKAFNVAGFVKPEWAPGLQLGGSYYNDRMVPPGRPDVEQSIGSFYVVYMNSGWESLNEIVLLQNHADGTAKAFHSPLGYAQLSRKFGKFRPYYRFQYVNIAGNDPINIFTGRYESHSGGVRMDFTDYVALKVQYNRLYQRVAAPENGVDLQMAFTF
jgi:hypothetical protein